jgi:hypothetical protein
MMQQVAQMRRALIKRNVQFFDWFVDNVGIQNIQMMHKKPVHNTSSASPQHTSPPPAYRHGMSSCFFTSTKSNCNLHANLIPNNIFAVHHKFMANTAPPLRSSSSNVL